MHFSILMGYWERKFNILSYILIIGIGTTKLWHKEFLCWELRQGSRKLKLSLVIHTHKQAYIITMSSQTMVHTDWCSTQSGVVGGQRCYTYTYKNNKDIFLSCLHVVHNMIVNPVNTGRCCIFFAWEVLLGSWVAHCLAHSKVDLAPSPVPSLPTRLLWLFSLPKTASSAAWRVSDSLGINSNISEYWAPVLYLWHPQ